jgi:quercetin dioxygenase-like cupin family protein
MSKIVRKILLSQAPETSHALPFEEEADSWLDIHGAALASLPAQSPDASARARFLLSLKQAQRFPEFTARIAELAELAEQTVSSLLLAVDTREAWEPGPVPNVALLHFQGGPSRRDAITGFVRVDKGTAFPMHQHVGTEIVVILQGALRDSDGTVHARGEEIELGPGTSHEFSVVGETPLIYLVVVEKGVKFGDVFIGPLDPRA